MSRVNFFKETSARKVASMSNIGRALFAQKILPKIVWPILLIEATFRANASLKNFTLGSSYAYTIPFFKNGKNSFQKSPGNRYICVLMRLLFLKIGVTAQTFIYFHTF